MGEVPARGTSSRLSPGPGLPCAPPSACGGVVAERGLVGAADGRSLAGAPRNDPATMLMAARRHRRSTALFAVFVALSGCVIRSHAVVPPGFNALSGVAYLMMGDSAREFDIFKLDVGTLAVSRITSNSLASGLTSSGSQVVASASRGSGDALSERIYRVQSRGLVPVREGGLSGTGPAVSLDGEIAYFSYDEGVDPHRIEVWDPGTGTSRTLISRQGVRWGDTEFARTSLLAVREQPPEATFALVSISPDGHEHLIFDSTVRLGTVRWSDTGGIAVLTVAVNGILANISLLDESGRSYGTIYGWNLLDWAPDGSGLLVFRDDILAFAPTSSLVPQVLGRLPAAIRTGAWLDAPVA